MIYFLIDTEVQGSEGKVKCLFVLSNFDSSQTYAQLIFWVEEKKQVSLFAVSVLWRLVVVKD